MKAGVRMVVRESIEIRASPEEVYSFLTSLNLSGLKGHRLVRQNDQTIQ